MLNNKAFSLLETLISLHVITFFVGLILPSFILHQAQIQNTKLDLNIKIIANNKLIEAEAANRLPINGDFNFKGIKISGDFSQKQDLIEYCIRYSNNSNQRKEECLYAKK